MTTATPPASRRRNRANSARAAVHSARKGHKVESIAALYRKGNARRCLKHVPLRAIVGCERRLIHLIGILDIPGVNRIGFIVVRFENDPILFSGADRNASSV